MYRFVYAIFSLLAAAAMAFSAQGVTSAVEGTVKHIDSASKTIIVKTTDGAEHTFRVTDRLAVDGAGNAAKGSSDTLHELKQGSKVVVHYSTKDTAKTAEEIDCIGKDGMKTGEGTIKSFDRNARTLIVKNADGTEETYLLSERAACDAGLDIGKGGKRSGKVTVYYTEAAGHKVAHFFKRAL